ncbi:MAG: polyprenyl diphosphate synthase [Myxococcota bacterium]
MSRLDPNKLPRHLAIIPDGNGRWAEAQGLPREAGHRRGSEVVREIIRAAHEIGIRILTLYAFSSENWDRPEGEVRAIMDLLAEYIDDEGDELASNGIQVRAIGRLEELRPRLRRRLAALERRTEQNDEMRLTFALSYSGRAEIVDAVRQIARRVEAGQLEPDAIDEKTVAQSLYAPELPDPDLLIRTGVERRVSNFLLWQLAYTELYITDLLWPDFQKGDLVEALLAYQDRERRFGRTGAQIRAGR